MEGGITNRRLVNLYYVGKGKPFSLQKTTICYTPFLEFSVVVSNQIIKDNRAREKKEIVPTKKIWEMHQRLEFPDIQEAHEVVFLEKN
ncbi:MAG: hypothetical protein COZ18_08060 [Flexibacter sp. CG_4_10_14_3_um_filter_32_15]|nr:MAG: hypothetical protein COZ18_08060 [Flexibacter sp. CG_4_10_14_3_um_filter_32_15]